MPLFTIYHLKDREKDPVYVGTLSHDQDDTLVHIRHRIDAMSLFAFPFDFWDSRAAQRLTRAFERGIKVVDLESKVIVTSAVGAAEGPPVRVGESNLVSDDGPQEGVSCEVDQDSVPPLLSSEILNQPSGLQPQPSPSPSPGQLSQNHDESDRLELRSQLMNPEIKEHWKRGAEKLEAFMGSVGRSDHKWKVKTWDEDGKPAGSLVCLECPQNMALQSMERASINVCFSNYKAHHLKSKKHHQAWCRKRGLPISDEDIRARQTACLQDDAAVLDFHVNIMQKLNSEQPGDQKPFHVIGDLERKPVLLYYYRVGCTFCGGNIAALVPQQRNLEWNLKEHLLSPRHVQAVSDFGKKQATLSGRPGRPAKKDGRDVKQKTIHGFFGHDQGRPSSSDSSHKGKGIVEVDTTKSQLCWGLWREHVQWNGMARNVKPLLLDQMRGNQWFAEPHVFAEVLCLSTGIVNTINGTFRHEQCSRVSELGGGFEDLTCEKCWNIKLQKDFRLRVLREQRARDSRGHRDTGEGRRLDYLTVEELRAQARKFRRGLVTERAKSRRLKARICMLEGKNPSLREVVGEAANSQDILKFCQSIVLAHKRQAFGGKSALWDMLKDIALNLNRKSTGKRYSKGTKAIMQALLQNGGRRVIDCLAVNMLGPSLNTLQRERRGMTHFRPGLHKGQFQLIAFVYSKMKSRLGITGDLPCLLAEDETAVKKSVRWVARTDAMIGFCGKKEGHQCETGLEIIVGKEEVGFGAILDGFDSHIIGVQARCVIVNPLHPSFPRLCILATSTCNGFDHAWVRGQWDSMMLMWNEVCRQAVGPIIGHASDGDSRRRKLMLQDYTGQGVKCVRQGLEWEGWQLAHSVVGVQKDAYGLHDQDFIHNGKKLINPLDSPVKVLKLGAQVATIAHLFQVSDLYSVPEHGLNREDILRTDRQNWASAQRLCGRRVVACLQNLRERGDARVEMTMGTELYLRVCGDYIDVFLNQRLTIRERVVLCAKVSFFFRIWRMWLFHGNHSVGGNTQPLTLKNTVSTQTFLDIQMSVHYIVLLVVLFRDQYPTLPIPFHLTGSDACEQFFSKVGGMKGHERSYDFGELIESATGLNRLAELDMTEGVAGVGRSHKKHKNIWMKLHPLAGDEVVADLTDYRGVQTNEEVVLCLKEGLALAQDLCVRLQMCPSTSCRQKTWFTHPWTMEAKGTEFGGWCNIAVEELDVAPEDDVAGVVYPAVAGQSERPLESVFVQPGADQNVAAVQIEGPSPEVNASLNSEDMVDDGADDLVVAQNELQHSFGDMMDEMGGISAVSLGGGQVDPFVSYDGRRVYKSTLVSQLVGNPHLSKDRLTRVKQCMYFNNLVDKPKDRVGARTMFMHPGSDVAVFFLQEVVLPETRAQRGAKRRKGSSNTCYPSDRVAVHSNRGEKAVWWLGRVQFVRKKYNGRWGRCREPIDLLDRPNTDNVGSGCEVQCNWFTSVSRLKFKYDLVDSQWISLDAVISTVSLSCRPNQPGFLYLDEQDCRSLDDFVKSKC